MWKVHGNMIFLKGTEKEEEKETTLKKKLIVK